MKITPQSVCRTYTRSQVPCLGASPLLLDGEVDEVYVVLLYLALCGTFTDLEVYVNTNLS